jgi:hypothetical protein
MWVNADVTVLPIGFEASIQIREECWTINNAPAVARSRPVASPRFQARSTVSDPVPMGQLLLEFVHPFNHWTVTPGAAPDRRV